MDHSLQQQAELYWGGHTKLTTSWGSELDEVRDSNVKLFRGGWLM